MTTVNITDDRAVERERVDNVDKTISTLIAQAAICGWTVHIVADGFVAIRCGWTRHLSGLDELQQFVAQIGAGHAC